MVGQCHLLPGTTKNSVKAKGEYDAQKHAALTLSEVRRWFVEQLLGRYHLREHRMLRIPPQVPCQNATKAQRDGECWYPTITNSWRHSSRENFVCLPVP